MKIYYKSNNHIGQKFDDINKKEFLKEAII
jgi:hypothetical protein